jgi:hypothetical protein
MANVSAQRRLAALGLLAAVLRDPAEAADEGWGPLSGARRATGWTDVIAVADELLVMPELSRALARDPRPPSEIIARLRDRRAGNTLRNAQLRRQLGEAVQALNQAEIVPLLFKGSLHLVDGSLRSVGDRWINDLDLLVPPEQFQQAGAALNGLGYVADPGKPFLHPHELPYYRPGDAGSIELHAELGSDRLARVLPAVEAWQESLDLSVADGRAQALSPTHQVLHNILHAAVQDLNHAVGGLPLRQLVALRNTARAHGTAIDWTAVTERMDNHGLMGLTRDYLWLATRAAGAPVPVGRWGWRPRAHELRVKLNFALGWPPHFQRNIHHAFGREYVRSLHGFRPGRFALTRVRVRHAVTLLRHDRNQLLAQAVRRRA